MCHVNTGINGIQAFPIRGAKCIVCRQNRNFLVIPLDYPPTMKVCAIHGISSPTFKITYLQQVNIFHFHSKVKVFNIAWCL
jgi:hypothetical protein